MKNNLYFCVDLGTSSLKAALIDSNGGLHGFTFIPTPNMENADTWLKAFYCAAERLASFYLSDSSLPDLFHIISALVISGSGPTLVPAIGRDPANSRSLRPIFWHDPPAAAGEISASFFLPKLKSFYNKNPAETSETSETSGITFFLSPQEWLSWKLGARPVTVLPHDLYIPYYWSDEECNRFTINRELLPPFVTMGTVTGAINPALLPDGSIAKKLLPQGVPIIASAADFIMALIGTNTLKEGMVCDRTGSSEGINLCTASLSPKINDTIKDNIEAKDNSGAMRILPHVLQGFWNLGVVIPRSGILFEENQSRETAFKIIGTAFKNALEQFENFGYSIKKLTMSGGQCTDPLWNQYKADISGKNLYVPEIFHAELAGNAVLCESVFSGKSIQETAAKMIRIKEQYTPRTGSSAGI